MSNQRPAQRALDPERHPGSLATILLVWRDRHMERRLHERRLRKLRAATRRTER